MNRSGRRRPAASDVLVPPAHCTYAATIAYMPHLLMSVPGLGFVRAGPSISILISTWLVRALTPRALIPPPL